MPEKAICIFIDEVLRRQRLRLNGNLEKYPLFKDLDEESLQSLLSNSYINDFGTAQEIVQQGEPPEYLYYIITGGVKTLRYSQNGEETIIRMLSTGDTFMEAVIFMSGHSPVCAKTLVPSRLLMIPAEAVRRQALHDPQFACNLLRIVTRHYKSAMQQIDGILAKSPLERLGYYFLQQHLEQGCDSLDVSLPFQKSMIANYLGMKPETLSRALSQMKNLGVNVDHAKLTLKDAYTLCHFCDAETSQNCPHANHATCPRHTGKSCANCH